MTLAWLLPVVLILRAGLVMAQDLDSTNLGISMYMKGEISNEHLATITLTDSHSVQWGYNGWTRRRRRRRRRDGENAKFEHQIKNGIWELMRSNEHDPVGLFQKESVESVGNKNQKKAIPIPILANHNNKVKKSVKKPSSKLPRSPQLSSSSPSPSPPSDTITRKHKNSLSPRRVTKNATRLNETTTTDPTDTSNADCSPNLPDHCINQNCTAAKPNCLIVNGNAGCFPRTVEGWRLSSCPESLSYTGPYRKENETCELLTTPTDPLTLTTLLSVILNTTNATEGYSTGPLRDYGNCDPSLYCDSTSTPSVCRPKLATEMECESSNQCQSGRCLEKQGGTGPTVCLGVDDGNGDQPTSSSSDDDDDSGGGGDDGDDDDSNDSNVPVRGENLKLILTIVLPTSAGILIIILIVVLAVRQRHRELRNYRRQVSYPKEILFQDGPQHTKWTNITRRPLTTIRESVIRFSRMTDTDDQEEQNASAAQQQRRDSNRQSLLLPPPPKLTNSLMWMQAPHPLKPVYERIRALRSPTPPPPPTPPSQQDDFGSAVQYPSGSVYTPTFASSSDSERIYQGYI